MKVLKKITIDETKQKVELIQAKHGHISDKTDKNNDAKGVSHKNKEFFKQIVDYVLNEDKFRTKLLKLAFNESAIDAETAFPKESTMDRFDYIGSGSYASVYRHETISKRNRIFIGAELNDKGKVFQHQNPYFHNHYQRAKHGGTGKSQLDPDGNGSHVTPKHSSHTNSTSTTIIKLIYVFSETLLKNLVGLCSRSSVTTYRDAYNEFRISLALSYLNSGLSFESGSQIYSCPIFPEIYACHIVKDSIPVYFKKRSEPKKLNYDKLLTADYNVEIDTAVAVEDEDEEAQGDVLRSKPSLKNIYLIRPEIAALKMEDCGEPIMDKLKSLNPMQVLSLAKQILLGFSVAEGALEFEHRDLHLGNILVKDTSNDFVNFIYIDKLVSLPCYNLQVKVIDTTFSRLKLKNRTFYRDLSHLFEENENSSSNNRLSHQDETYQAMAKEVKSNWSGHYPRTNIYWCIYIIKKLLRSKTLRKNMARDAQQVKSMLSLYIKHLSCSKTMYCFFMHIYYRPELNKYVPIKINTLGECHD